MTRAGRMAAVLPVVVALTLGLMAGTASAQRRDSVDRSWPVNVDGKGCAPPVWPGANAAAGSRRVLVIGDSLIRDANGPGVIADDRGMAPDRALLGREGHDVGCDAGPARPPTWTTASARRGVTRHQ